jgi:uncharacterized protein
MSRMKPFFLWWGLVALAGCASYSSKVGSARIFFESAQYDRAADEFKKLAESKDNDVFLYLAELGLVYHSAGRYPEAIEVFKEAEKIAVLNDYTSVSQEVSSVLLNETTKVYKGEDFEKILVNVYLAIDYTLMGQWDEALVECRRVNQKLDVMIAQGKMPYEHNAFAKYLAASLFESQKELNDAFVDYRTVKQWRGDFPYLPGPLMRVADRLKALEELESYQKEYASVRPYTLPSQSGEVILLLEQGRAPLKVPNPQFDLIPMFRRLGSTFQRGILRDEQSSRGADAEILFDIEETAVRELDEKMKLIIASKVGGIVAKRAAAYGVGRLTKSREAEFLSFLLLSATDKADLRSWVTLPAKLRLARLSLPAGRHNLVLDMVFQGRKVQMKKWENVVVKPGQISFLNLRVFE